MKVLMTNRRYSQTDKKCGKKGCNMPFIECCSHLVLMSNNDFLLLLNKLIATTTEKWIILLLCGLERTTVCYKLSDWKTGKKTLP
jgi:hypothetical protein